MTAEQLDEIQKSLDAATPGPWEAKEKEVHTAKEDIEGYKTQVCKFTPSRIAASNIHLIANAPTWLRSLLAEVQRLQSLTEDYDELGRDFSEEVETLHAEVQRLTELNQASQRRAEEFITGERERLSVEVQRQQGEIERLTKLQAFTQAEVKSVRNRLTNEVQPETDILDESRASLRNLAQHNHRKWIEEEERAERLQAENDQFRQQVQHEHNLHMQEMDERRKARDEVDQLRQQLGEAVEVLNTAGVRKALRYPIKHDISANDAEYDQIIAAQKFIDRLKGDRTDG
ncbi:hypothetical protein [Paenibacillus humicus]|uniref:hypothetical protein n=1 Tax=Paenibacillus humicus TaxID=412861 RepID=UPI000FD805EE|nr:hypothetical protein [Paenibacillus humicus]